MPQGFSSPNSAAELLVHPSGKFLYTSTRCHDSIAVFRIESEKGTLVPAGWVSTDGKTPRNFGINSAGTYLIAANQDSDSIAVFQIDVQTGQPLPTGQVVEVAQPVCVRFAAFAPHTIGRNA